MKKFIFIFFLIGMFFTFPSSISAKEVNAYLFYGDGCPHCEALEKYLDKNYGKDKDLKIYRYEVWKNQDNVKLWQKVQDNICTDSGGGVPYLVVGNKVVRGYNEGEAFENKVDTLIRSAKNTDYKDIAGITLGLVDGNLSGNECEEIKSQKEEEKSHKIDVPLFGKVDLEMLSLPVSAGLIGLVDGFNPCAMWVLIFLITLLLGLKDRKKMWILGLTFIFTSGFIYFLFMLGVLTIRDYTASVVWLRSLIAIFALVFGGYNLYRYIRTVVRKKLYNEDEGCEVTSKDQRKKIMTRAKNAISSNSFILSIFGIIVLAVTVNFIELLCSLGLPVVFTELLSYNGVTGLRRIIYLIIYVLFFLLDDIIVFTVAMKTLKITAISNKYTKYSHLIGGLIMVIIGLLMLLKPEWLMFNF